jgi:hypothetical protein
MELKKKPRSTEIGTPVMVRLQAEPLLALDEWRRAQSDLPGRPRAVRRLIEIGLAASAPRKRTAPPRQ